MASGALLVAIVSVWTTAQISGIEDYFRSEISRRNNDLNSLADQTRRLGSLADERERRVADLQSTTEQMTASNLAAQGKLLTTQQELSRLGFAVLGARQTLISTEARLQSLSAQTREQSILIDLFRRQRFFERANQRLLYAGFRLSENGTTAVMNGEAAYRYITNWSAGDLDSDLAAYLPEFVSNARNTCEWIRSYKPEIPAAIAEPGPYPRSDASLQKEWNARWAEYSNSRRAQLDAAEKPVLISPTRVPPASVRRSLPQNIRRVTFVRVMRKRLRQLHHNYLFRRG